MKDIHSITDPSWMVRRAVALELDRCVDLYVDGQLLDVGCGDRNKEKVFEDEVERYWGLDHPDTAHGVGNADILATADQLPMAERSLNTVTLLAVLEHLEKPGRTLKEVERILAPGGHLIMTVPLFWHIHEEPRDFYRYTEYGLRYLLGQTALEVVEITPLSGFLVTFATEFLYYCHRVVPRPLKSLVAGVTAVVNRIVPLLDRGRLRDEAFTWMYIVVARKPGLDPTLFMTRVP